MVPAGRFNSLPSTTIALEPPPSRLIASTQPRSRISMANSWRSTPRLSICRPSTTSKTSSPLLRYPAAVLGCIFGIVEPKNTSSSDVTLILPSCINTGPAWRASSTSQVSAIEKSKEPTGFSGRFSSGSGKLNKESLRLVTQAISIPPSSRKPKAPRVV